MKARKKNRRALVIVIAFVVFIAGALIVWQLFGHTFERGMYKQEHLDLVHTYATEKGLDPYLVAAVVYTESNYDADALSNKGAIGLMQIMPDTGAWIASKLGLKNFTTQNLYDANTNLTMGCWYLNFLLDRYNGQVDEALAAYNAGQGSVDKWLNDTTYSQDGKTLTSIPYGETDNYVIKVQHAYDKYLEYYPSN